MLKYLLAGAGLVVLAGCANDYVSQDAQMCIVNTGIAMQSDPATKDLRPMQKAALIAGQCGVSVDEIIMKAAE